MPLSRYSVVFGTLACLGLPFNPPVVGCLGNPLFYVFAGFAGLGLIFGVLGLIGPRRGLALAGMGLSVASPFGAMFVAPQTGGSRNEPATLGDIRTVIETQKAYKELNGGLYGTLECLAQPSACVAGYPPTGPVFLDSTLASGQPKSGYERRFIAGPPPANGQRRSMTSYAYVAVPTHPRLTGTRAFCGDSSGALCVTVDGQVPPVVTGRCITNEEDPSSPCIPLR